LIKKFTFVVLIFTFITIHSQEITNSIVVGGVTNSSARFWMRISEAGLINVELSENDNFSQVISGNEINVDSSTDYAGIIDVSGLKSETLYYYRAVINGNPEEYNGRRFTTFPVQGEKSNFSFAFGACQQSGSFLPSDTEAGNVFREILKHDIRFFLQLGDWTYPDTTDFLPLVSNFFSVNFEAVQKSYHAKFNKDYPMDSLLRILPVDYIYDDHDYMNNNSSALTSSFYIPVRPNFLGDDFLALEFANPFEARENSINGYIENFPGYPLANESRGIYHKFSFGNVDFFALDLRSQRDGDLNPFYNSGNDNQWVFDPSGNHTILGRDDSPGEGKNQMDWFLDELKNSSADWKFIMSSVPFNIGHKRVIDKGIELQDSLLSLPELPSDVQGIFAAFEISDSWAGFPADYDSILSFIKNNDIHNVIVLSGDSHNSAMDDGSNSGLPEIMSGNLEITNSKTVSLIESFDIHIWNKGGQGLTTDEFNNAFGKVTVFGSDSIRLELIDEFGERFATHTIDNETTTGVYQLANAAPVEYSLKQNYPNPFNPSTKIKFSIPLLNYDHSTNGAPVKVQVNLNVYDILGRKVAELVNEEKQPGEYEVTFKADGLANGIYFYRLIAGNFSITKKMILLK